MTNPYSPPQTESEGVFAMHGIEIASTGKRFLNYLLDTFFYYIILMFLMFFLGIFGGLFLKDSLDKFMASGIFFYVLVYGVMFLYYWLFEILIGKTPAKLITGTMVIHRNGTKAGAGQIAMRTLFRFIPFDAFSYMVGSQPVGWHDRWSGTLVVNAAKLTIEPIQEKVNPVQNNEAIVEHNIQNGTEFASMEPFKVPFDAPDSNLKKQDDIPPKNPYT